MKALRLAVWLSGAALAAVIATFARPVPGTGPHETGFVIQGARVFDGERLHERADVRVAGGRIEAIGTGLEVPAGYRRIDAKGRTLLPGLIDAHVHTWGEARRDALRFGVTTLLDMFTDPAVLPAARSERESTAATDQADLWSAGFLATAAGGHGTQFGVAVPTLAGPDEAAAWVAARKAEGSDWIKIVREDLHAFGIEGRLPTLDDATMKAVIEAAHEQGLRAVVHASARSDARSALRAGADGLVHVFHDEVVDEELIETAKERNAFVVATLGVTLALSGERSAIADDPDIAPWLAPGQKQTLGAAFHLGTPDPRRIVTARENVRRLHAAGIVLLAGTDAPNPSTAHGASLHAELEALVQAGLTPIEALRAATSAPAHAFGLADRGRIAPGLRADLLLVEGDPTRDVRHTRRIVTIWKNGHAVDRRLDAEPPAPTLAAGTLALEAWTPSTDRRAGGASDVTLAMKDGVLGVQGSIVAQFQYPWAGAMHSPGPAPMQPVDARERREIVLRVRGDGRDYSVLLFSGTLGGIPASKTFTAGPEWRELRLPLQEFAGADLARLRAIAVTAGAPAGAFALQIGAVEIR